MWARVRVVNTLGLTKELSLEAEGQGLGVRKDHFTWFSAVRTWQLLRPVVCLMLTLQLYSKNDIIKLG